MSCLLLFTLFEVIVLERGRAERTDEIAIRLRFELIRYQSVRIRSVIASPVKGIASQYAC